VSGLVSGDRNGFTRLFDLRESPQFALATLGFGIAAFLVAMWFDTRDPHRLGRHSATAFWLHMLAAPALVNTVALTLYNTQGTAGIGLLVVALVLITVLALVIDRRSFLTAAIAYIALVIAWVMGDSGDFGGWTFILIALGGLITAIGTWWVPLRAFVMRVLPDFPGKASLPPYAETP
jgi:membrane-associated HD superfamily phosphohydrolase